jgi:hypothetical protein
MMNGISAPAGRHSHTPAHRPSKAGADT